MTLPRLFPSSFMRSHATDPHVLAQPLPAPTPAAPTSLSNRTLFVSRCGESVRGMGDLRRALSEGWRIVALHSEAAPEASPLDFSIRVTLAMTQHEHVSASGSAAPARFGNADTSTN